MGQVVRRRDGRLGARSPSAARRTPGEGAAVTSARLTKEVADRLAPYQSDEDEGIDPLRSSVEYPEDNELGERLQNLAGLLAQPLGIRVATVQSEGDFDTHDRQRDDHTRGPDRGVARRSARSRPTSRRAASATGC